LLSNNNTPKIYYQYLIGGNMLNTKKKYIACLMLTLCLVACTKTEKWGYVIDYKKEEGFWASQNTSPYQEIMSCEITFKNNLVSIKESLTRTEYTVGETNGYKVPTETTETIIGPCQYVDDKNWKCGKYQMFNGELKEGNGKMFRE
jgi:hypothetical protein